MDNVVQRLYELMKGMGQSGRAEVAAGFWLGWMGKYWCVLHHIAPRLLSALPLVRGSKENKGR